MKCKTKICGITEVDALEAAIAGHANYVGFVFYKASRRFLQPEKAVSLVQRLPRNISSVGLFVDPLDADLDKVLACVDLDVIQLHGAETPQRLEQIKKQTGLPVMKALPLAQKNDLDIWHDYESVADMLLFDAYTCDENGKKISGGLGQSFDWQLLSGFLCKRPWFLAGGLNETNLAQAVAVTGAKAVDVSSGVENASGQKDVAKIKSFLRLASSL